MESGDIRGRVPHADFAVRCNGRPPHYTAAEMEFSVGYEIRCCNRMYAYSVPGGFSGMLSLRQIFLRCSVIFDGKLGVAWSVMKTFLRTAEEGGHSGRPALRMPSMSNSKYSGYRNRVSFP